MCSMRPAFAYHGLPAAARRLRAAGARRLLSRGSVGPPSTGRVQLSIRGRAFASVGGLTLSLALTNRLLLTGADVSPFQARADIIGVVCGVSLLLYGVGRAEIAERGARVQLRGVDVGFETTLSDAMAAEAQFLAGAALGAVPNFVAAAVFLDGRCIARQGLFRTRSPITFIVPGELVQGAIQKGEVAYLADLRVVPTREIDFPFLPEDSQAAVVVPFAGRGAVLFVADKVRPMKGKDFGWLSALADRFAGTL